MIDRTYFQYYTPFHICNHLSFSCHSGLKHIFVLCQIGINFQVQWWPFWGAWVIIDVTDISRTSFLRRVAVTAACCCCWDSIWTSVPVHRSINAQLVHRQLQQILFLCKCNMYIFIIRRTCFQAPKMLLSCKAKRNNSSLMNLFWCKQPLSVLSICKCSATKCMNTTIILESRHYWDLIKSVQLKSHSHFCFFNNQLDEYWKHIPLLNEQHKNIFLK